MKFTSEDLLKAMGLKDGQTVCVDNTMNFLIYKRGDSDICFENLRSHSVISADKFVEYILDFDYYIIQPKPILTEDENNKLKDLNKKWKWIVRNEWEYNIALFTDKPNKCITHKEDGTWGIPMIGEYTEMREWNNLFQFIKWEDEPYSIEELSGQDNDNV